MTDSTKKATGTLIPIKARSGPIDIQAATDSDTGSSSSSSQAAVGAEEVRKERSASAPASDSDDEDEMDIDIQKAIKSYLVHEIDADEAVATTETMANSLILWENVIQLGVSPHTDQDRLVSFCRAVLSNKDQEQWHDSFANFRIESRDAWDGKCTITQLRNLSILTRCTDILGDGADVDVTGRPRRRALNQFFARLNAANITNDRLLFVYQFSELIEPRGTNRPVAGFNGSWAAEQLRQLADYFDIAGAWIKSQFDVVPWDADDDERWKERLIFTEKRWNGWKQRLIGIREATQDDDVRENALIALKAMEE